jgi:hypothetical protein
MSRWGGVLWIGALVGVARVDATSVFFGDRSVNSISLDVGLKIFYRVIQWFDGGA